MSRGFMGKKWDGGDVAFDPATWRAVYRVLKPGAHLVAFGGTRTYARMAVAIEDAGFEIRDTIAWLYGSGFPKSHDVSKGIDRMLDADRNIVGTETKARSTTGNSALPTIGGNTVYKTWELTEAATLFSNAWDGWGTALKPAMELLVLARKPLSEGTVAANVLKWGTGAINVDGSRIGLREERQLNRNESIGYGGSESQGPVIDGGIGRWPANVTHDGSAEVEVGFPQTHPGHASEYDWDKGQDATIPAGCAGGTIKSGVHFGDAGSAARFFYTSKADADDRLGSKHPTVKPLDLMQWLVRLVTPPRGLVLDPFAGTGTTAEAAFREGMRGELIEAEAEYQADIRRRMALALAGPDERVRESIKARNLPRDDGPLFASRETWNDMWQRPFDWSKLEENHGSGN
jgi:site-specific DNA-methyltransferase (adenine-specific)